MRYVWTVVMIGILAACAPAADKPAGKVKLETDEQKVSYIIGTQMAMQLKNAPIKIDVDLLTRGVRDTMKGNDPLISPADAQQFMAAYMSTLRAKQEAKMKVDAAKGDAVGKKFLAENAKAKGVITTKSGLQYQVIKPGKGPKPAKTDKVKVHYTGTLLNGKVFDSSVQRKAPATFGVTQVIPGWVEGLQLMPVGSKYKFFIPSDLAYGPSGRPPTIPPSSMLIFEVELLEIVK